MHETSTAQDLLWKLAKWARTKSHKLKEPPQFPPLKRSQAADATLATNFSEKVEILRVNLFFPILIADLSDILNTVYPDSVESLIAITREEIERAIRRSKVDKAPGISQILNKML